MKLECIGFNDHALSSMFWVPAEQFLSTLQVWHYWFVKTWKMAWCAFVMVLVYNEDYSPHPSCSGECTWLCFLMLSKRTCRTKCSVVFIGIASLTLEDLKELRCIAATLEIYLVIPYIYWAIHLGQHWVYHCSWLDFSVRIGPDFCCFP